MAEPDAQFLLKEALTAMRGSEDGVDMNDALPALTRYLGEFAAAGFVCEMHGLPPTPPATFPGVEGLAEGWRDYGEAFEMVRVVFQDIRESEGYVVSLVDQVATTRHGGVEMSQPSAMLFAFEAGRVARVEFHLDHEEALRAAGIPSP